MVDAWLIPEELGCSLGMIPEGGKVGGVFFSH
jgi:hypothetical protein